MDKLISDSETFQVERPMTITNDQLLEVFNETAEEIRRWNACSGSDSVEDIVADLDNAYMNGISGYEMAKSLEDDSSSSYDISSSFIEILESIDRLIDDKKRENVKQWINAHGIKPKLEVGAKLTLTKSPSFGYKTGEEVFITIVNLDRATYCINKEENGNGGRVISFEVLESCI